MPEGFQHQKKITAFKTDAEENSVEIGAGLIKSGFLTQFPEASLSIFLYLASTAAHEETCTIRLQKLSCLLPVNRKDLKQGLNYLEEREIITLKEKSHPAGELLQIDFHPEKLLPTSSKSECSTSYQTKTDNGQNTSQEHIASETTEPTSSSQSSSRENELTQKIMEYFPEQKKDKSGEVKKEIEKWHQDFPPALLEQLLERVRKWLEHPSNPRERAHYYLRAIISDWYEKKIFSLEALKEYDRIYRETKELAKKYGFKSYQQLNPVQLKTLQGWLSGTRALPVEVASLAIEKAIKQKSDGRPSLDYIERNYIKPLKDAGVKSRQKAKEIMAQRRKSGRRKNSRKQSITSDQTRSMRKNASGEKSDYNWEDFLWENNR